MNKLLLLLATNSYPNARIRLLAHAFTKAVENSMLQGYKDQSGAAIVGVGIFCWSAHKIAPCF